MRWLLALVACAGLAALAPVAARSARTAVFIHGYAPDGSSCIGLRPLHTTLGEPTILAGVAGRDTDCDSPGLAGTGPSTTIADLARHIADVARRVPGPVDLVGHSEGGLIAALVRADLPAGKVAHLVTISSPWRGVNTAMICGAAADVQCAEMTPGSGFTTSLVPDADLCVGSTTDVVVPITSSVVPGCRHELRVTGDTHVDILVDPTALAAVRRELEG